MDILSRPKTKVAHYSQEKKVAEGESDLGKGGEKTT